MSDQFTVDVHLIKQNATVKQLQKRKIEFKDDCIELARNGSETTVFRCTQFHNRPLKLTKGLRINISFNPNEEKQIVTLTIEFKKQDEQYIEWVVDKYNEWLVANKDKMPKKVTSRPTSRLEYNPPPREVKAQPPKPQPSARPPQPQPSVAPRKPQPPAAPSKPKEPKMPPREPPRPADQSRSSMTSFVTQRAKKVEPKEEEKVPNRASASSSLSPPNSKPSQDSKENVRPHTSVSSSPSPPKSKPLVSQTVAPPSKTEEWLPPKQPRERPKPVKKEANDDDDLMPRAGNRKPREAKVPDEPKPKSKERTPSPPAPPPFDELQNRKLANTGNSCYLNSTLQALSTCPAFVERAIRLHKLLDLDDSFFRGHSDDIKFRILKDLVRMMYTLSARYSIFEGREESFPTKYKNYELRGMRERMGKLNSEFDNDRQQDAHDYYMALFGAVDDIIVANQKSVQNRSERLQSTAVAKTAAALNPVDAFRINTEIMYYCTNCKKSRVVNDCRTDLGFPIKESCSVQDLLAVFTEWSKVEKDCHHCGFKTAYSTERVSRFPQCLIVYLKLYEFNKDDLTTKKKKFQLGNSFEIDASVLQTFADESDIEVTMIEEHPEPPGPDEEDMVEVGDEPKLVEKLLGGNSDMDDSSQEELIVEAVKAPEFRFQLFSSQEDVDEILTKLEITSKMRNMSYKNHLEKLRHLGEQEMLQNDAPDNMIPISPDGNCFYRAISWCLTGKQSHHPQIRKATAKHLAENKSLFLKYVEKPEKYEEFVKSVKEDGEWSNSCEIFAVASMLNVRIFTYLGESTGWVGHSPVGCDQPCRVGSIYLSNVKNHFEPTLSVRKKSPTRRMSAKRRRTSDGSAVETIPIEIPRERCGSVEKIEDVEMKEEVLKEDTNPLEKVTYQLQAAVCHKGQSPYSGHYVAYTKGSFEHDDPWMYCSDSEVYPVTKKEAEDAIRSTGYILFYDRD